MSQQSTLHNQLRQARDFSEKLLTDFRTPQEWTHQLYPGANHALWFAGHMAVTDDFFLTAIDPSRSTGLPDLGDRFGMGSKPTGNPQDYPPPELVLTAMRERRAVLLGLLETLGEADFERPSQGAAASFLPTWGDVFATALWHEGLHAGQLSMVRRALGHPPVMG